MWLLGTFLPLGSGLATPVIINAFLVKTLLNFLMHFFGVRSHFLRAACLCNSNADAPQACYMATPKSTPC